jgi:DNA-binding Lrp family transcriptional regulator
MVAGFVFIKCELGQVETVANKIVEVDGVSEVYSISGNYDLLVKVYVEVPPHLTVVMLPLP